ncbi:putative phage tail assembly chaperone [uncultured Mediterranean phage uvMED]|nr:putative phage tail assembly chaperone [uncultured Mediterranean phage uvMED]BAR21474.1 putative phage tail assembly chaperone [uncultured Mediterranean phage uvMED]
MGNTLSALDRLRKAANLEPKQKEITLSDGSVFEMYVTPLTMAERDRAQRLSKDDNNNFALQLLMTKALDETGRKLFNAGEIDVLKNEVKDSDLQKLMLAVITETEETIDPKD